MKKIFVLVEHRKGEILDVTYELLSGAGSLASKIDGVVEAILIGYKVEPMADKLKSLADRIITIDQQNLENFNSEHYQKILTYLIGENNPYITLIAHSCFGVDLAPSLAVEVNRPLITDCYALDIDGDKIKGYRQMYGGKVNVEISPVDCEGYIFTIRPASFTPEQTSRKGEIVKIDSPIKEEIAYRKFLRYVEVEAGEVDITQADIVVGIGRGIKEKENIQIVQELAEAIGGVVACSRPVVDAGWLPKERQVGSSGKTIKPKLYIALGISGAFQHVSGMKGSDTIVAVNKDSNAPIFGVADFGIVGDLMKVVPVLKDKIKELKAS